MWGDPHPGRLAGACRPDLSRHHGGLHPQWEEDVALHASAEFDFALPARPSDFSYQPPDPRSDELPSLTRFLGELPVRSAAGPLGDRLDYYRQLCHLSVGAIHAHIARCRGGWLLAKARDRLTRGVA